MSSFEPRAAGSILTQPDQTKHVNYSLGMVLGVDDFTQEFAYVSGRDQWMARDLLGYGTACGLRVTIEQETTGGPQVVVTPGAAVSPRGQLVRVKPTQCADLNEWLKLDKNKSTLDAIAGSHSLLRLYVVLCYRECKTDQVPIPGEPCRSEEESMAASRVSDDFSLELRFDAPDQREEDALRDFVAWLEQMEITDAVNASVPKEQFEAAIRGGAHLLASPPPSSPPDYMFGSPPTTLRIRTADACEYLRAAFRIWITELRPLWLGQGQTSSGSLPKEECVLLAELGVPILKVGAQWAVDDNNDVAVDEERRPFLLHLRMLQEWIECGRRERSPSDTVQGERHFGQQPRAGVSNAYSRADHTHGTPDLVGDVTVTNDKTVVGALRGALLDQNVASPPPGTIVLLYDGSKWRSAPPPPIPLEGDVTEMSNGNQINFLQGIPLIIRAEDMRLEPGQVLTYVNEEEEDGGKEEKRLTKGRGWWQPSNLTIQGAPVALKDENIKITRGQVLTYVEGEREGEGIWQASELPVESLPDLSGDVTGPLGKTEVGRIHGVEVFFDPENPPREGQALVFVEAKERDKEEKRGVVLRLEPGDVSGSGGGTTNLVGDVTGALGSNTVRKIQGTTVADLQATPPLENQVLTFKSGSWTAQALPPAPAPGAVSAQTTFGLSSAAGNSNAYSRADHTHGTPPLPTMQGDVTGRTDSNTVARIQGVPVNGPNVVQYQPGAVMTFRNGSWTPELASANEPDKTSVQHPDVGPYSIVAAGIVRGNGAVRGPSGYNGLTASVTGVGRLTVSFNGYENPEKADPEQPFFYIVKALPVNNPEQKERVSMPVILFETYQQSSLVLRVVDSGAFVDQETLATMEFMIEISRYDINKRINKL